MACFRVKLMDGGILEFKDLCNKVINMDKELVTFVHESEKEVVTLGMIPRENIKFIFRVPMDIGR